MALAETLAKLAITPHVRELQETARKAGQVVEETQIIRAGIIAQLPEAIFLRAVSAIDAVEAIKLKPSK